MDLNVKSPFFLMQAWCEVEQDSGLYDHMQGHQCSR